MEDFDKILPVLMDLLKNYKTLGLLGIAMGVLNIAVLLLKSKLLDNWFSKQSPVFKSSLIVLLGQLLGALQMFASGTPWFTALWTGFLTSGGAVATYELLIKPLLKKKAVAGVKA